jgi:UDP-glucose 4-epimerase
VRRGDRAIIFDVACRSSQGELRGDGWGQAVRDPARLPDWLPEAARRTIGEASDALVLRHGDVCSLPELLSAISEHQVDSIVHAAAIFDPVLSLENPFETFRTNVDGAVCVCEAARIAKLRRLVHLSTIAVITAREYEPIDERHPLFNIEAGNPSGPHGSAKAAAEVLGMTYFSSYGVDWVGLRLSAVYGYGMRAAVHIRPMVEHALAGTPCVFEKGQMYRDYMYVDDAVAAVLKALDVEAGELRQRIFNIGSGEMTRTEDLAKAVKEVIPTAEIVIGADMTALESDNMQMRGRLDIGAAKRQLKWEPQYDLRRGIEAYALRVRGERAFGSGEGR